MLSVAFLPLCSHAADEAQPGQGPRSMTPRELTDLSLEDLMRVKVATVTTASKKSEKTTEAPGMAYVIDKNDIRLRGYSTLKDVLRDLPGMDVADNFFSELGSQVSVRGINSNNRIVVLLNGMRVNPPGGEYFPFRSDFSVRFAEQIEVIYGPGSTLYGQDAISAVINVKTKQPPASGRAALELGGEFGLNMQREIYGSFGKVFDPARNFAFDGYVQYHDSNLTRLDKEYPNWWRDYSALAAPKGRGTTPVREDYGLNAYGHLQLGDFSVQSWYRESRRSSAEGYGGTALYYVDEAIWKDRSLVTEAKYDWKISDRAKLTSAATFNWFQVDPSTRYIESASPTTFFLDDFKYANGTSYGIEETYRLDLSKKLSMVFGGTFNRFDIIPKSTIPGGATPGSDSSILRQGGNFVYYTVPGDASSRHEISRAVVSQYNRYGSYLEFGWQIAPKLKLIAGGRVDKDSRIDNPSYTPRAALIYNVTDALTLKYTYSWAYISPAPYFGFATYDRGDIINTSNPNLQPETSKTHELNITYNKKAVELGLSLYYGEQENLILVSDVASQANILSSRVYLDLAGTESRVLTNTVNGGTSHNMGLDFYGKAKLNRALSLWFSYSYASYQASTNRTMTGLNGISPHNFRLGCTWAVTPKLFVTPSIVARSTPRNVNPGRLSGELTNPWEANLNILYKASDSVDFYITLQNATDNHYALTSFTSTANPQETFTGVVGIRIAF